jgi:hypothetical protein
VLIEEAYKTKKEDKLKTIYVRMDETMHRELCMIRNMTGVSLSEIIRGAVRKTIVESKDGTKAI